MKQFSRIRTMLPSKRTLAILLLGITLIVFGISLFLFQQVRAELARPLGPTLPVFPTTTPQPYPQETGTPYQPLAAATPQATGDPKCGGPPQMLILAIGSDSRVNNSFIFGLADVIRIVRIDFVSPSITSLAFPRDTWVEVPGLEGHGDPAQYFGYPTSPDGQQLVQVKGNYARINASYFYGNLYGVGGGGPRLLAETLYRNFGLPIDHYVAVTMNTVSDVIDHLDGIEVDVPYNVESFSAGLQHMTGSQAAEYARLRQTDNDFYRVDRQTEVLLALRNELLQPATLRSLPSLANTFLSDVSTDLSKTNIAHLICIFSKVEQEDITARTVGPDMLTPSITTEKAFILLPDEAQIRNLVTEFINGSLPPS